MGSCPGAEGPKEGTYAGLEAKALWKNKDWPHKNHPKVETGSVPDSYGRMSEYVNV